MPNVLALEVDLSGGVLCGCSENPGAAKPVQAVTRTLGRSHDASASSAAARPSGRAVRARNPSSSAARRGSPIELCTSPPRGGWWSTTSSVPHSAAMVSAKPAYRRALSGTDVIHWGPRVCRRHRPAKRRNGIADKGEIAHLSPVAIDLDWLSTAQPIEKDRDNPGIRRARILTRSVQVEKAQTNRA